MYQTLVLNLLYDKNFGRGFTILVVVVVVDFNYPDKARFKYMLLCRMLVDLV